MMGKYPNRIMVINFDDLLHNVESIMQEVFHFIGLEWKTEYLNMANLKKKFANYGTILPTIPPWEWKSSH